MALALLGFCLGVSPEAMAQMLPEIKAHSQTEFAVYRGDKVALEVQATGDDLAVKWLMSGAVLCRELSWEADTSTWGLGLHPLTFVVFNGKGSLFLRFHVTVLLAPAGYRPGKVRPPLADTRQDIESVAAEDLTVRSVFGRGFSYHKHKLQVVGPLPRALDWEEKLRTQPGGLLRFGRDSDEEHLLAGGSAVYLAKADSGRRAVVLAAGTLRSRNLAPRDPSWAIVAGDWLQIDTDALGDVLVTAETGAPAAPRGGGAAGDDDGGGGGGDEGEGGGGRGAVDAVTVTVLRGNARVFVRRIGDTEGADAGVAVTVPTGLELRVVRGAAEAPRLAVPDAARVGPLVSLTSPQYLPDRRPAEAVGETVLGTLRPADAGAGLKLAAEAMERRDPFAAIEALARFPAEAKRSFKACLTLGETYLGLFLYQPAELYLAAAATLRPDAPQPHRLLGRLEMSRRDWGAAAAELDAAVALDDPNAQVAAYELGVAADNAGERSAARAAFARSLWSPEHAEVAASAQRFADKLRLQTWLDLRFAAGVLYDSNVLRSNADPRGVGSGLGTSHSVGVDARAGASLWGARGGPLTTELALDTEQLQYLASSLAPLTMVDEKVALKLAYGGSAAEAPRPVAADAQVFVRTVGLGGQRALDEVGGGLGLGLPALLGLRLGVEATLGVDPQPARDFLLDPVRWELAPPGDRSVHLAYEDLRMVPLASASGHLDVSLRAGGAAYRNELIRNESFRDLGAGVSGAYAISPRSAADATLRATARRFPGAADGRSDRTVALALTWRYLITPALAQTLSAGGEAQQSTRAANTYRREVAEYGLDLAF